MSFDEKHRLALEELAEMLPKLMEATGFTPNSYQDLERIFNILGRSDVRTLQTNANCGFLGYLSTVKMVEHIVLKYFGER